MSRFLDDDSVIDSGNELQLTTVAVGSDEESHRQQSASKVHFFVCSWSQTSELHNIGNLIAG
jgi:hypothetical protein